MYCSLLIEKIRHLDIFGQKPQFNIDKKDSFQTNFGGFLTIASITTTILTVFYFSLQLFDRGNPKLVSSIRNIFNPSLINLNNTNYGFSFGLQNPFTYDQFIDESIYRAEVIHMTGKRVTKNNKTLFEWTSKKIETEICSIDKFPEKYKHLYADLPLSNLYCLKDTSFSLYGTFLNEEYQYIMINLYECTNENETTLENNQNLKNKKGITCKPEILLDEILAGVFFGFYHTDLTLDPTNYTNPDMVYIGDSYTTLSNKFFKEMHHYINIVNFETDKGSLITDIQKETFLRTDYIKEMTDLRKSENFLSYTVKLSTKIETYARSYTKIQNIAAEAGGFIKILSIICYHVSFYYNKAKFYQLIGEARICENIKTIRNKDCNNFLFGNHHNNSNNISKFDSSNEYSNREEKNENKKIKTNNLISNNDSYRDNFNKSIKYLENSFKDQTNNFINNSNQENFSNDNRYLNKETSYKKNFIRNNSYQGTIPQKQSQNKLNLHFSKTQLDENNKSEMNDFSFKNPFNNRYSKTQECSSEMTKIKGLKRIKLNFTFCESFRYIFCYLFETKNMKYKKLNIIRNKVDDLLDILKYLKNLDDVERLKKLIMEKDQLLLFDLPNYHVIDFNNDESYKNSDDKNNCYIIYNNVAAKDDPISKKLMSLIN